MSYKIGTLIPSKEGLEKVYAGPKYGNVSQEEYNRLLESGALGRGQQTVEMIGDRLIEHGSNLHSKWESNVGKYIPDIPGPNEKVKGALGATKNIAGHVYNWTLRNTVEQTMDILGAPVEVIHKASKLQYEDGGLNFGGRGIGRAPLGIAETVLTAGAGTAKNLARRGINKIDDVIRPLARVNQRLQPAYATVGVTDDLTRGAINTVDTATEFKPNTVFASTTAGKNIIKSKNRTILGKKSTSEADRRFNRVEHMESRTINTFKKKAGDQYDSLAKKLNASYEHYEKTGNLKGMEGGSKWVNEDTGEVFLIKNKAAANERVKLGVDSLESVAATKALREASATITLDDVIKVAKETGIDEATAVKYFNKARKGKKDLMKLIYSLNKEAGKKLWSLGHRRAVKALRDAGSGHADMLSNIELEPLMNVVDDFGNVIVRGNSGRGAVDELPNALNTALNSSRNLREELLKFKDKDLGEFWPKMGPITDEASFLRESAKRDAFIKKVLEVNKKTKNIKVAIDEVLTASGMMKEGMRQPSTFLDASVYENLNI